MILASENISPISNLPICRFLPFTPLEMTRDLFVQIYFKKSTQITLAPQKKTQTPLSITPSQDPFVWIYFKKWRDIMFLRARGH